MLKDRHSEMSDPTLLKPRTVLKLKVSAKRPLDGKKSVSPQTQSIEPPAETPATPARRSARNLGAGASPKNSEKDDLLRRMQEDMDALTRR